MQDNNRARLQAHAKTYMNHYMRKVPSLLVLNTQINELTELVPIYAKKGSESQIATLDNLLTQLNNKKNELNGKLLNKSAKDFDYSIVKERIKNDEVIQDLYKKQKDVNEDLNFIYPSRVYTNLVDFRRNMGLLNLDENGKDIVDIDNVNVDYSTPLNNELRANIDDELLIKEFTEYANLLADMLEMDGITAEYIMDKNTSPSRIRTLFTEKFGEEVKELRLVKERIDDLISARRMELTQDIDDASNIVSLINEIIPIDDEMTDDEIEKIKNIMTSTYVSMATAIAQNVCNKYNNLNNLNDAISGALMALSETINKWFEDRQRTGNLVTFGNLVGANMKRGAERAIIELGSGSASASTQASIISDRKKSVEMFRKYNKGSDILSDEIILSIVADNEMTAIQKGVKGTKSSLVDNVLRQTSESDLSAMIGEEEEMDYWDIYEDRDGSNVSSSDLREAIDNMKSLSDCINKLMNYFDYESDNLMFDEIDKIIFFNQFSLATTETLTHTEIAEIIAKETAEKEGLDIEDVKVFSDSFISNRVASINDKIQLIVEQDDDIRRALEYLFIWMKQNPNASFLASNYREEMKIRKDLMDADDTDYDGLSIDDFYNSTYDFDDEMNELFRY